MSEQHKVVLHGPAAGHDRVSGHVFRDLLDVLVEGAERALRLQIEGRSTAKGAAPHWLRQAADFSLVHRPEVGASAAVIEASPLMSSMPERFRQGELFDDLDPRQSPIELFEAALEDALAGDEDSGRYDSRLLETFERLGLLFGSGIERVEIINGRTIDIDESRLASVRRISAKSYPSQRVRVAGRLEAIRYSDCRFTLVLESGTKLQGTALDLGHEVLKGFFGRTVLVDGTALFRASGQPSRIEAARIEAASERALEIWSTSPKPLLPPPSSRGAREEQRSKGGLSALLGQWPGEETDEEMERELETLS